MNQNKDDTESPEGSISKIDENNVDPQGSLAVWQLNNAIVQIGPGPYQLVILLLGGGVYTAEGSLLLMLSVIAKSLIERWKLSAWFAGAMVSIIFVGLLAGTIAGGVLCDRYGRRMPILVTYGGITLFLTASFMSPDVLLLVTAKFMLGVSLGFGVPAANAIVCESCPATHRSNVYCMTMVLFSLGQMYSAVVIWMMSPNMDDDELHWRGMLALATLLPLVLFFFSYFFLLESPHWLLMMHRYSEAKAVIYAMAHYKGSIPDREVEELTTEIRTPPPGTPESADLEPADEETRGCCSEEKRNGCWLKCASMFQGVRDDSARFCGLFSKQFFTTTVLMSYISFVSNFAYFGMIYGLPDTLKREQAEAEGGNSETAWSPAAGVFFSAVFEIPGVFVAMVLGMTVGRKVNMTITFGGVAVSLAGVALALWKDRLAHEGLLCVFSVKLFIAAAFIVVYLYLLECYPTKFRATGLAFCMVVGRMGAFLCPFLYDGFVLAGFHHLWFFITMGVLVTLAAVTSLLLPYETKDTALMEDTAPLSDRYENSQSEPEDGGPNYSTMAKRRGLTPLSPRIGTKDSRISKAESTASRGSKRMSKGRMPSFTR